jgi:hypothetical protein
LLRQRPQFGLSGSPYKFWGEHIVFCTEKPRLCHWNGFDICYLPVLRARNADDKSQAAIESVVAAGLQSRIREDDLPNVMQMFGSNRQENS